MTETHILKKLAVSIYVSKSASAASQIARRHHNICLLAFRRVKTKYRVKNAHKIPTVYAKALIKEPRIIKATIPIIIGQKQIGIKLLEKDVLPSLSRFRPFIIN